MTRRRLLQGLLIAPFAGMFAKKAKTLPIDPAVKLCEGWTQWIKRNPNFEAVATRKGYLKVIQDGVDEPFCEEMVARRNPECQKVLNERFWDLV